MLFTKSVTLPAPQYSITSHSWSSWRSTWSWQSIVYTGPLLRWRNLERNWSHLSWRWLLDESPIVSCNVAVVAVLLQHVNLQLDLLLLILSHVHHWGLDVECLRNEDAIDYSFYIWMILGWGRLLCCKIRWVTHVHHHREFVIKWPLSPCCELWSLKFWCYFNITRKLVYRHLLEIHIFQKETTFRIYYPSIYNCTLYSWTINMADLWIYDG